MRFLLTFHMSSDQLPNAELNDKCFSEMMEFVAELKQSKILVYDSQVRPDPAPVRFDGETINENLEDILGGFFIIEVPSHNRALELARRCPHNQVGPVELHALNETDENAYQPGD